MSSILIFLSLLATLSVTLYFYVRNIFSYWQRRGIKFLKPKFPFGNFPNSVLQKVSFAEELKDVYDNSIEPVLGIYTTLKPSLLVRDPQIIQEMVVTNYSSFNHRGWYGNAEVDPMADNLLLQSGEEWKHIAFSSGKLKAMFDLISGCGASFHKFVGTFADTEKTIEIREASACYATNVISSVAFGLDVDCFSNPNSEFRKYGHTFFEASFKNVIRSNLAIMNPALAKVLRMRFVDKEVSDFFVEMVQKNLEYREKNNVLRKDFFQLLIQLRNSGKIDENGGDWHSKPINGEKAFTLEQMAAQAELI